MPIASVPPDAFLRIHERTGIVLEGFENLITAAKLDTVADQAAVELELRLDVTDPDQRRHTAAQLRLLADRLDA